MSQRMIAVCVAGPLAAILLGLAMVIPLPYGLYSPGPTFDILGKDADQAEIIQVDGHKAYYDDGQLRFTTVLASPYGAKLSLGEAISKWLDPDRAVVPYEVVHPPEKSQADEKEEGAIEMTTSQDVAKAVALTELGFKVPTAIQVAKLVAGGAAEGKLLVHDIFVSVDGKPVTTYDELTGAIGKHTDGSPVTFVIKRDKRELTVKIAPKQTDGSPKVGIYPGIGFVFPFGITLRTDPTVGGPSAGLMFSLAIYDTLTPGSLTGGATVAGTGTLDADGKVGPIGGIEQKIAGAEAAGAELFFVPVDNCADVAGLDPDLRLVKATTMHEARQALEAWVKDHNAALPAC